VKHLLKELDRLIEAALERILQPTPGNSSENTSPPLDLQLWHQIPLVLIDEHDKDNPVILDIFESNQAAGANQTAAGNRTAEDSQASAGNQTSEDSQTAQDNQTAEDSQASAGNQTADGNQTSEDNQTATPPAPANMTSEEKKYKLAVKLVRGVPREAAGEGRAALGASAGMRRGDWRLFPTSCLRPLCHGGRGRWRICPAGKPPWGGTQL